MHDIVVRNGQVVDGTGAPASRADVAIEAGVITAVGAVDGAGRREIDAEGRIVTPGWVDIHTHYDGQATWDPDMTPSGWHGVTTVVMGNCGVGFAPCAPERRRWLIELMEGVEDIPGTALDEGMTWNWETFPEYLDELETMPRVMDVAALVPHGAVRAYVMGDRGASNEEATSEDVARMAAIVREALEAGAAGFSTTRTLLHRSKSGELAAGTTASAGELIGIGRAMGEAGSGVFEVASDMWDPEAEFAWMSEVSRVSGRPVTFGCLQDDLRPEHWRTLLEHARRANADDTVQIVPQVAGRPACLLFGWDTTMHPFATHSAYREIADLPVADRIEALADPVRRETILCEKVERSGIALVLARWDRMFELGDPPDYEPAPDASIAARAAREGVTPEELAYDTMLANGGRTLLYQPLLGYSYGDFSALRDMLTDTSTVLGLGDGGAHCGLLCDASLPTYMLSHWVRDRTRGERLTLEEAVHHQTRRTARLYGFDDRGVLAPGYRADLNVIDFEDLGIDAPEIVYDLPAGGRRLIQRARGYSATIKSGTVTFEKGVATGERPGILLRGAQQAP